MMEATFLTIKMPRRVKGDPVIYVCSPYAGDREANAKRAERYCRFVWEQGGIPLAPHLLFPRFLCEDTPAERQAGLKMARKLLTMCDEVWVFGDRISQGMAAEIAEAAGRFIPIYHMDDALTLTIEARQARRGW